MTWTGAHGAPEARFGFDKGLSTMGAVVFAMSG